jgi:hypothetical protein
LPALIVPLTYEKLTFSMRPAENGTSVSVSLSGQAITKFQIPGVILQTFADLCKKTITLIRG